ncbi:hypothetical protein D3C71_1533430 [compost metagenome]
MFPGEFVGAQHHRRCTRGRQTILQPCQGCAHLIFKHGFQAQRLAVQRIGIERSVFTRFHCNHGERFFTRAIPLHVFARRSSEQLCSNRYLGQECVRSAMGVYGDRRFALLPPVSGPFRWGSFKANCQHTFGDAVFNGLARQVKCCRTTGTMVADIDNRDSGQTQLCNASLTGKGIAADETGIGRFDPAIFDAGVLQCQAARLSGEIVITIAGTRRGERGHAYANHIDATIHVVVLP